MTVKTRKFRDVLHEDLQDPEFAQEFLNAAFKDYQHNHDMKSLLLSLRHIAAAYGIETLAKKTGRSRGSLYKSLNENGDPKFSTILELLKVLGFEFGTFQRLKKAS